jgi:NAD(P)-dependent dehydrogenase (short-subunit alcohol dehydrogenase family)
LAVNLDAHFLSAKPEDIVGPVAFLTSDDAQFVTGQAVVVDGGLYKVS